MPAHADILDRPEPMAVPFWVSMSLHVLLIGGLSAGALLENRLRINMGSPTGGGMGGVVVNPVASIPLPDRGGPRNPVANDTESMVPTPPKEKAKPAAKEKSPSPNAIALKNEKSSKKQADWASQLNKFREQQKYSNSQLYSGAGQALSSPMNNIPGGGDLKLGDKSPFGEKYSAYANLIRDNIARNWHPSELNLRASNAFVVVTFTIRRDGSIANVKVGQNTGASTLNNSAQRAVLDAKLPELPPGFPKSEADVELRFELGK